MQNTDTIGAQLAPAVAQGMPGVCVHALFCNDVRFKWIVGNRPYFKNNLILRVPCAEFIQSCCYFGYESYYLYTILCRKSFSDNL